MIGLRDDDAPAGPPPAAVGPLVARIFAAGGDLQSRLGLEHRPGQEAMALAVAEQMELDQPLLAEAGTGVGKSLAYLVPGILRAIGTKRPLVVSTHTIPLQQQLRDKDLPLVRRLFTSVPDLERYAGFEAAVLVGKAHYLCNSRLALALAGKGDLFSGRDLEELQRIADWADGDQSGLRQNLSPAPRPEVWDHVNADSAACSRKHCSADTCCYRRARAGLYRAQVRIVNHSLLFALVSAGGAEGDGRGILYPHDFVVLDEAHEVPAVATEHLGLALSSYSLHRLLTALFHPAKDRGLLKLLGLPDDREVVVEAMRDADRFFSHLDELLGAAATLRVRQAGVVSPAALDLPLERLLQRLELVLNRTPEGPRRDELEDYRRRLGTWRSGLLAFCSVADNQSVHWLERTGSKVRIFHLRTAPIDVAPHLQQLLFRRDTAVVLTSATLRTGQETGAFAGRVGADGARDEEYASPFDYRRAMRVFVAEDMPEFSGESRETDVEWLAEMVGWCALRVRGGSLVLFTSFRELQAVAGRIEPQVQRAGRKLLVQVPGTNRAALVEELRQRGNAILLGAETFWTGVDVPGPALSQVIVARLPFSHPAHPIPEARREWIESRGGNSFNQLTLPDALMQFRQGAGRLIRTTGDRGVLTLLDSRLLRKNYGRHFLSLLPQREFLRFRRDSRDVAFAAVDV